MDERIIKSEIAMLKLQQRALEKNVIVCKPTVEGQRYDCVLDFEGSLKRAQVKYAGFRSYKECSGVVLINLVQIKGKGKTTPYLSSEIDFLMIYLAPKDVICCFDKRQFENKKKIRVRYELTKNKTKIVVPFYTDFIW